MPYRKVAPRTIKATLGFSVEQSLYNRILEAYQKRQSTMDYISLSSFVAQLVIRGLEIHGKEKQKRITAT